jgi:hypothetical protein
MDLRLIRNAVPADGDSITLAAAPDASSSAIRKSIDHRSSE